MDIGCNCFGVATAAKVPVKRYNLLVPAVFPVTEPNPNKPLSVGVDKNINRLSDYLERNEHRIPKVCLKLLESRWCHSGQHVLNSPNNIGSFTAGFASFGTNLAFGSRETEVWICESGCGDVQGVVASM